MESGARADEDHIREASPDAHTSAGVEADAGVPDSGPFHEPVVGKASREEGRLG